MNIMGGRLQTLTQTIDGLNSTGIPLIAKVGDQLFATGATDDLGIYYFVPAISKGLGISLQASINIFLLTLILSGWIWGSYGFLRIFKNATARLLSVAGLLLLAYLSFTKISDVYVTMMFAVAAFVPNFLAFSRTRETGRQLLPWFGLSGIVLGYCNFIRSHSGTGILIYLAFWLFLNQELKWKQKAIYFVVLLACFQLAVIHFRILEKNRDDYLTKVVVNYQPRSISHPFWHSVYIGLGYLPNPYGIEYLDGSASKRVASVDPKVAYCSDEYGHILELSVLEILKKDPFFVIKTLAAKAGKLLLYILVYANFGLLCFFYVRPSWREILPMMVAGGFYALPGLLVMPHSNYVLGMIGMATIFGILMTGSALEKYIVGDESRVANRVRNL